MPLRMPDHLALHGHRAGPGRPTMALGLDDRVGPTQKTAPSVGWRRPPSANRSCRTPRACPSRYRPQLEQFTPAGRKHLRGLLAQLPGVPPRSASVRQPLPLAGRPRAGWSMGSKVHSPSPSVGVGRWIAGPSSDSIQPSELGGLTGSAATRGRTLRVDGTGGAGVRAAEAAPPAADRTDRSGRIGSNRRSRCKDRRRRRCRCRRTLVAGRPVCNWGWLG